MVVPPGAWAVGRTLGDVRGPRRGGGVHRDPPTGNPGSRACGDTVLRDGDIVVIYGQPEELERAESVLLAG